MSSEIKEIFVSEGYSLKEMLIKIRRTMNENEVVKLGDTCWKKVSPCRSNEFQTMLKIDDLRIPPNYLAVVTKNSKLG